MANVLVMLEFLDSEPLCASLEALGQARRLGSALGFTVYALLPMQSISPQKRAQVGQLLGFYGADNVVMLTSDSPRAESELRFAPYARALLQACDELPPKLFLMADTPAARDLAPRLAARLGGIFLAHGEPVCENGAYRLFDADGQLITVMDDPDADDLLAPLMVPVVVTVPVGRYAMSRGSTAVPVRFVAALDEDAASERTPVPGGGFSEDGFVPYSTEQQLWLRQPDSLSDETIPPLFVVVEDGLPFDRRLSYTAIGIGSQSADRGDVQLALPVAESAQGGIRASIELALAKPREKVAEPGLAGLLPFEDVSDEEPAISVGRAWDGSDISTGDTEPRAAADPLSGGATPSAAVAATGDAPPAFPRVSGADSAMWDDPAAASGEHDAAPDAELEGMDTEPIEGSGSSENAASAPGVIEKREEQP